MKGGCEVSREYVAYSTQQLEYFNFTAFVVLVLHRFNRDCEKTWTSIYNNCLKLLNALQLHFHVSIYSEWQKCRLMICGDCWNWNLGSKWGEKMLRCLLKPTCVATQGHFNVRCHPAFSNTWCSTVRHRAKLTFSPPARPMRGKNSIQSVLLMFNNAPPLNGRLFWLRCWKLRSACLSCWPDGTSQFI